MALCSGPFRARRELAAALGFRVWVTQPKSYLQSTLFSSQATHLLTALQSVLSLRILHVLGVLPLTSCVASS